MSYTIEQIQDAINAKALDARQLVNLIADYLQANPSGGGGGLGYLVATKVLNNDEIIALPTTAIILTPVPAAGKVALPLFAYFKVNTSGGAYSGTDADTVIAIGPGSASGTLMDLLSYPKAGGLLGGAGISYSAGGSYGDFQANSYNAIEQSTTALDIEAKPIVAQMYNTLGNLGDGNANNTLTVTLFYMVIDAG